jgi:hypothetical protein
MAAALQVSGALTAQAGCVLEALDSHVAGGPLARPGLPAAHATSPCAAFLLTLGRQCMRSV